MLQLTLQLGINPTFGADLAMIYQQRTQMLPFVGKSKSFTVIRALTPRYWLYKPFVDQGATVIYQVRYGQATTDILNDMGAYPKGTVIGEAPNEIETDTLAKLIAYRAWSNNLCAELRKAGYAYIGPTLKTANPKTDPPITGFWCDYCNMHYYGDPMTPGWWEDYFAWQAKCFIGLDGKQKPIYCTEFGCQTWNHSEDDQLAITAAQLAYMKAQGVKIACAYQFADQGPNTYEGKFGVFGKKVWSLFMPGF